MKIFNWCFDTYWRSNTKYCLRLLRDNLKPLPMTLVYLHAEKQSKNFHKTEFYYYICFYLIYFAKSNQKKVYWFDSSVFSKIWPPILISIDDVSWLLSKDSEDRQIVKDIQSTYSVTEVFEDFSKTSKNAFLPIIYKIL